MRRKSLSILAGFLVFSLAITSCLNSDNDYEPGSDNLITAFSLDTIYGVSYKFTIDQINGLIYNVDSVPYSADTIINKILIKLSTNGYVTAGPNVEPFSQDTLFYHADSINFIEHNPLNIRVRSYDGLYTKQYKIEVRMHRTDPDTLVWKQFTPAPIANATERKAVLLGNDILLFASDGTNITAYKGSSADGFREIPLTLPLDFRISSIRNFNEKPEDDSNEKLYAVGDGKVFSSGDGESWTEVISDDAAITVVNLLTTFNKTLAGIINTGAGADVFAVATLTDAGLTWKTNGITLPDDFPTEHIVATKSYTTPTLGQEALLIGKPVGDDAAITPCWYSKDGLNWGKTEPSKSKYALPAMNEPSILYYGNTIYAFGDTEDDGFSYIYTSANGIVWEKIEKKFMFPLNDETSVFKNRSGYAVVVDKDNYIWMFWDKEDDIWRGKLNRLGFDIQ